MEHQEEDQLCREISSPVVRCLLMKGKKAARGHELLAHKDLDLHGNMKELMYG
jgi:hypothetical protein